MLGRLKKYRQEAEQGNSSAQFKSAECYMNGIGFGKNEKLAIKLYQQAAEKGHVSAKFNLADYYMNTADSNKDEELAVKLYEQAAEKGHVLAKFNLADYYMNNKKDEELAIKWYLKAAEQGYVLAQFHLARYYMYTMSDNRDEELAFKWYQKAAAQGYALAKNSLGYLYFIGHGVKEDKKIAVQLYQQAAEKGDKNAKYNLACCYVKGIEVPLNMKIAFDLFQEAAVLGHQYAQHWIDKRIAFNSDFILQQLNNKNCPIPYQFLTEPVDQNGPYCGAAAFAAAINFSGCLPYQIYASPYEKKLAGKDISKQDDIVTYHLQKFGSKGPIFDVNIFSELAKIFAIKDCQAVIQKYSSEEEYRTVLCQAFEENFLLIACDHENGMPGKRAGKGAHWVLGIDLITNKINSETLWVQHHGYNCEWKFDQLYKSNEQLPEINPYQEGGNLQLFNFTIFKIPKRACDNRRESKLRVTPDVPANLITPLFIVT